MMNRKALLMPTTIAALALTSLAPALADDRAAVDRSEASPENMEQISREQARQANEAAVEEAAEAVEADARLDLACSIAHMETRHGLLVLDAYRIHGAGIGMDVYPLNVSLSVEALVMCNLAAAQGAAAVVEHEGAGWLRQSAQPVVLDTGL